MSAYPTAAEWQTSSYRRLGPKADRSVRPLRPTAVRSRLLAGLIDLRLLFERSHRPDVCEPWLRGAGPPLRAGDDLVALTNGAHADGVNLGACSDRRCVDMRSTFRAKRLWPFVAAFGGLDVDFRLARKQPESVFPREGVHAECRARERLAVGAIAEQGLVRLDLRFKGDVSAVTTPVDFHLDPPQRVHAQESARANGLQVFTSKRIVSTPVRGSAYRTGKAQAMAH